LGIERKAFRESGLTSIHLPASIQVLDESSLLGCESLQSVTIEPHSKIRESGFSNEFRIRFAMAFSKEFDPPSTNDGRV
jgi:hypothetical protein